jgi:two-component system invasion response regulator UvrY
MIRILIADDHAAVRRGLRRLLACEFQGIRLGEAKDEEAILAQVRAQTWDLLILDLSLGGRGGIDVLADVRRLDANLRILVFSMYPEDQYAHYVLRGRRTPLREQNERTRRFDKGHSHRAY